VARIWQITSADRCRRGRPPLLGLYQSVVVTLILLRPNLSQATLADLVGVSQSTVSRAFRRFAPLIGQALCLHIPPVPDVVRGRVVVVDGTLVPTGNRAGCKHNYSGKRHRAGLNVQVLASLAGDLLAVSPPSRGSIHDRAALAETGWEKTLAEGSVLGDLGYRGTTVVTPTRKPVDGELSPRDKEYNKELAAMRSAVERVIAHLKNWKILASGYRGRLSELPAVIRIVTALEFYRLGW
jgi:hypothetical protein